MNKSIFAAALLFSTMAMATEIQVNKFPSKCVSMANQAAMDYSMGMDPDGSAFYIGDDEATQIHRQDKIVSREVKGDTETIVYRTQTLKNPGSIGQKMEFETVNRKVTLKREGGKLVSITKDVDLESQIKMREAIRKWGTTGPFPLVKSSETTFVHNGDDCNVKQQLIYEMADEKAKAEAKVIYDKAFCDKLAPMIKQMGTQNANQCIGLISQAQALYEHRDKELQKEGKSFRDNYFFGEKPKAANHAANFSIGSAIVGCTSMDAVYRMSTGMGMYGQFGSPSGYSDTAFDKANPERPFLEKTVNQ